MRYLWVTHTARKPPFFGFGGSLVFPISIGDHEAQTLFTALTELPFVEPTTCMVDPDRIAYGLIIESGLTLKVMHTAVLDVVGAILQRSEHAVPDARVVYVSNEFGRYECGSLAA